MKVIVFSASYGSGHLSTANSIKLIMQNEDIDVLTISPIEESSKYLHYVIDLWYNKFIVQKTHNNVIKKSYELSYDFAGVVWDSKMIKFFYNYLVKESLKKYQADFMIQTFPVKISKKYKIPNICFITDYGTNRVWIDSNVDHYFVAHDCVKSQLINFGIQSETITVSGIPVSKDFMRENDSQEVKRVLLILGGHSTFLGETIISELKKINYKISIICGKNEKTYEMLCDAKLKENVTLYKFVDNMSEIMYEHDLIVTKPGGISLTEAIYLEKPVIINSTFSVGGQENYNIDFVLKEKIGLLCTVSSIFSTVDQIRSNNQLYISLRNNIRNVKIDNQHNIIQKKIIELSVNHKKNIK